MANLLVFAVLIAIANCFNIDHNDHEEHHIGKVTLMDKDVNVKTTIVMKLLNHVQQPTYHTDIKEVAREFKLEDNTDKFMKAEVVRTFLRMYKTGMLPRYEVFTHTSHRQMDEAIRVFHLLYYANDFDTFIKTCCYLRERINPGMFVYAMTVAVMHREDCTGILLPAPYEIYPNLFVDNDVIHKAHMMKMKKCHADRRLLDYFNIKVTDKNVVVIDSRKSLRNALTEEDRLNYFTEDIDLNTYYYYFHMNYPYWLTGTTKTITEINKERYGEMSLYLTQQLLARYNLERMSHRMCNVQMLRWDEPLETGHWPKIQLTNGEEMPVRVSNRPLITDHNQHYYRMTIDYERRVRDAIMNGHVILRDGTKIDIRKPEDIEMLGRLIMGNLDQDDTEFFRAMFMMMRTAVHSDVTKDRYSYVPTATDELQTRLRDPMYWRFMKRILDNVVIYKKLLPKYTREQFDFPGIRIEGVNVDKLSTFMDEYDMDITNAVYLDDEEVTEHKTHNIFVARQRRLNHRPFKVTLDVMSDKTVDAVIRVFLGPKHDCMGALLDLNEKRHDMVEIDTFLHKLENGKNTIVRDSEEMYQVIGDRTWSRKIWDKTFSENVMRMETSMTNMNTNNDIWYKYRTGYPHRLLLPKGHAGGLDMQMYFIITPVRAGINMNNMFDAQVMKRRGACRWSVCFDTTPLGFPFDREIDTYDFFTGNMKFVDVKVHHIDMDAINDVKDMDMSNMMLKRDDLTWTMDKDLLIKKRMMDLNLMDADMMHH